MKKNNSFSSDILKQLWKNQLDNEYNQINWSYKLNLVRPHIKVVDFCSYYGQWDPLLRELKISFSLIEKHSWSIVKEVLKHEMAHQMVTDSNYSEVGHGPIFKDFCRQLGIDERFQKAQSEINIDEVCFERLQQNSNENSESQKLLQRIEKLLSLAQSSNQNEALAAMEKVNELYEKYNIEKIHSHTKNKNYQYLNIPLQNSKISAAYSLICSILMEHFFVDIVLSSIYNAKTNSSVKNIELFGTKENLIFAEYVFHFLVHTIEELWTQRSKGLERRHKRSFQLGLLHGFNGQLKESKKQRWQKIENNELVKSLTLLKDDPNLMDFIATRHPRIIRGGRRTSRIFSDAFTKGLENGKSIVIHKGIEKQSKSQKISFLGY